MPMPYDMFDDDLLVRDPEFAGFLHARDKMPTVEEITEILRDDAKQRQRKSKEEE